MAFGSGGLACRTEAGRRAPDPGTKSMLMNSSRCSLGFNLGMIGGKLRFLLLWLMMDIHIGGMRGTFQGAPIFRAE